jgi:hypothetical protein
MFRVQSLAWEVRKPDTTRSTGAAAAMPVSVMNASL